MKYADFIFKNEAGYVTNTFKFNFNKNAELVTAFVVLSNEIRQKQLLSIKEHIFMFNNGECIETLNPLEIKTMILIEEDFGDNGLKNHLTVDFK